MSGKIAFSTLGHRVLVWCRGLGSDSLSNRGLRPCLLSLRAVKIGLPTPATPPPFFGLQEVSSVPCNPSSVFKRCICALSLIPIQEFVGSVFQDAHCSVKVGRESQACEHSGCPSEAPVPVLSSSHRAAPSTFPCVHYIPWETHQPQEVDMKGIVIIVS